MCWMNLEKNKMAIVFREKVEEMKDTLPIVTYLRDDALTQNHWAEINKLFDKPIEIDNDDVTLNTLLDMKVKEKKNEIGEI